MNKKELEGLELRERIMRFNSEELWNRAVEIWMNRNYDNLSRWARFFFTKADLEQGEWFKEVKDIQMDLLDKEVKEILR